MNGINVAEYVNYVFETGIYNDIDYHYVTLGILPPNTNNMYIKTDLHNIYVNMNGEWYILIDRKIGEPVFTDNSKIIIYKKYFSNLKEDSLITSYGRAICNKIQLNDVFGDHIEYRNSEFNIDDVSSDIAKLLASRIISVDDLMACGVACQFMEQLSTLVTISCTNKLMTPPPGIDQYKQTLVEEFNKEFGSNWVSDRKHITNFTDKLLKYDDDYLKDDPTYGIVADKKVKNVSRAKLFGSMGAPKEFDSYDMSPSIIINSLHQGYPLDNPVLLAKTFNTARSGSYDRGSSITNIPNSITFASLTSGSFMFNACASLTTLPSSITFASLTNGYYMFNACTSLTTLPSSITFASLTNGVAMFSSIINKSNYSQLLINIASYNTNNNVTFNGGGSKYNTAGQTARNQLTGVQGWVITDGGYEP